MIQLSPCAEVDNENRNTLYYLNSSQNLTSQQKEVLKSILMSKGITN